MSFLAPTLLAGLALVAIPVVLHLVMRREPKKLEFPALRFVRTRQSTNQHRLRLRHWLLLALRCAFLALLAFALARPVLRGSGLLGEGKAGLAAALVFDNSPRMQYSEKQQTRLDEAKQTAGWLLEQLPIDSQVAVTSTGASGGIFSRRAKLGDRDSAILRTNRLRTSAAAGPLGDAIVSAITLVAEQPDSRQEVYVFSDLSAVAWSDETLAQLSEALESNENVKLYVVDVGAGSPANAGLAALELSADHLSSGESLRLQTKLVATGAAKGGSRRVEAWLETENGPVKRGDKAVALGGDSTGVEFSIAGLEPGVHQGYLRLVGDDGLPVDNTRYFTLQVAAPPQVLLVGGSTEDTRLLREALAPSSLAQTESPRFACETISYNSLRRAKLAKYDAVALLDPPPLADESWRKLSDLVQSGGGVAIYLGRNAVGHLDEFNAPAPRLLMPAALKWVSSTPRSLQPTSYEHPVLRGLADVAAATPWPAFPVFKAWAVGNLDPAATVVATFADGSPAVVQGVLGSGRILLMTTPVSDRASGTGGTTNADSEPWNLLPTNPDPWPFLALAEGMMDYLVGADNRSLNYQAGKVVSLSVPRRSDLATYVLRPPTGDPLPQSLAPGQQEIVLTTTDEVGNYRVVSGGEQTRLNSGFTVNAAGDVGMLERTQFDGIAKRLGADRVALATDRSSLSSSIDLGRVGRELYPWLIALVALALGCEQWLADRFYKGGPS